MTYHILNGDALKSQLEGKINGQLIIARECLVDGPVASTNLSSFYEERAQFLSTAYGDSDPGKYYEKVVPEFEQLQQMEAGAEVNLWFEEDLFCQVNCWFVLYLLKENGVDIQLSWVLPTADIQYGFGGMSGGDLLNAYENRKAISKHAFTELSRLWPLYQKNEIDAMQAVVATLNIDFPFLSRAITAHRDRLPQGNKLGRPKQALLQIMQELGTREFGPVFQAFHRQESIYGFGDLQVKRMFDELVATS